MRYRANENGYLYEMCVHENMIFLEYHQIQNERYQPHLHQNSPVGVACLHVVGIALLPSYYNARAGSNRRVRTLACVSTCWRRYRTGACRTGTCRRTELEVAASDLLLGVRLGGDQSRGGNQHEQEDRRKSTSRQTRDIATAAKSLGCLFGVAGGCQGNRWHF